MHCVCQHLSLPPQVVLHSAASVSDSSMSSRQPCASELRAVCRFRFQFGLAVRQHVCQIDGKLSPTSCAMFLVSVCVCVCVSVCVCQAVPNSASSRRWPFVPKWCAAIAENLRPSARRRVFVCDRVPTQGSRVCLGAGQAVPNPASSRRWPFREGPES